jgi:O-antigen/teichoic acid export membrane protein
MAQHLKQPLLKANVAVVAVVAAVTIVVAVAAVAVVVTITIVVQLRKKMMERLKSSFTSTAFLKQLRAVSASVLLHSLLSAMARAV